MHITFFTQDDVVTQDDNDGEDVMSVAKKISEEIKAMSPNKSNYTPITPENLFNNCSKTLKTLLSSIKPKLENSLPSAMICSIVTSAVTANFTPLQLSLGLFVHEKNKIN